MIRGVRSLQTMGGPGADKADTIACSSKDQKRLHGEGVFGMDRETGMDRENFNGQ